MLMRQSIYAEPVDVDPAFGQFRIGRNYRLEQVYRDAPYTWRVITFKGEVIVSGQDWEHANDHFNRLEDSFKRNEGKTVGQVSFIPECDYEIEERLAYAAKRKTEEQRKGNDTW
jgi:hypothetical protein